MKSISGRMSQAAQELFGEDVAVTVPRLMSELKAPHRVAATLGVAPNAVRQWLMARGWFFNGTEWVERTTEVDHA